MTRICDLRRLPGGKALHPGWRFSAKESERIREEGYQAPRPDTEPVGGVRVTVPKKPKGLGKQ